MWSGVFLHGKGNIDARFDGIANGEVLAWGRVGDGMGIEESLEIVDSGFEIINIAARNLTLADGIEADASHVDFFAVGALGQFLIASILHAAPSIHHQPQRNKHVPQLFMHRQWMMMHRYMYTVGRGRGSGLTLRFRHRLHAETFRKLVVDAPVAVAVVVLVLVVVVEVAVAAVVLAPAEDEVVETASSGVSGLFLIL